MNSAMATNLPFARNYASELLNLTRGKGVYLWDAAGNRYLDLGAGIAVNSLGYGRRDLAQIAAKQMRKVIHVSNLYTTEPSMELATMLLKLLSGRVGDYSAVQFGNSGSEANEAALKYARLYALQSRGAGHHKILSFSNAFHGRTMGALSATPNPKYSDPFEPLVPGMVSSDFNDVGQLRAVLNDQFAAVIVEVVQGEGGLQLMSKEFAEALNSMCRELDVVLIVDEVQTGLARTGALFASEIVGLRPDIITIAKPLAGGLPLSATVIPDRINELLHPGDHGTTFGGGPVTTAVACHVVKTISDDRFMAQVASRSAQLAAAMDELVTQVDCVTQRRGTGMIQGLAIEGDASADRIADIMNRCREEGVLLLRSSSNVVRIAPPLVIGEKELAAGIAVLRAALTS